MNRDLSRRAAMASVLFVCSAAASHAMRPTRKLAVVRGPIDLEHMIPTAFGDWRVDTRSQGSIVNPQTQALLDTTYNQILTRTYTDAAGTRLMLSIAYGEDQTDSGVELHHPEVCYPAQGFRLIAQHTGTIHVLQGDIPVKRLETVLANQRFEPVTYWIMIGDVIALSGWEKKKAEWRHGLKGELADGLLFRVSTIDADSSRAFDTQDRFVAALVDRLSPSHRARLAGLN